MPRAGLFGAGSPPRRVSRPYLGSSRGRRRTRTPPSRTQGSGHLAGREQSKGTIPICPTNHTRTSTPNVPKAALASSGAGAGKGFPWATMPRFVIYDAVTSQDRLRSPSAGFPAIPATGAASEPQEELKSGRREEGDAAAGSAVTSERLVQVLLAEDDVQVVHGARVELHAENHVAGRAAKLLVVALELRDEQSSGRVPPLPGSPGTRAAPGGRAGDGLLTKISPFSSSPGSMVMQMPVWLSPCTLLRRGTACGHQRRRRDPTAPCLLLPLPSQELPPCLSFPSCTPQTPRGAACERWHQFLVLGEAGRRGLDFTGEINLEFITGVP